MDPREIREHSIGKLATCGIPSSPVLPLPDPVGSVRSVDEVADRIIALYALTGLAHDAAPELLIKWLEENESVQVLSTEERLYFDRPLTDSDLVSLSWRQESLFTLAWTAKLVPALDIPFTECDLDPIFPRIPPEVEVATFSENLQLRSGDEIALEADVHYCLHWIVRHPESWGESMVARKLNRDVILERREVLEWLLSTDPWGDVSLDT